MNEGLKRKEEKNYANQMLRVASRLIGVIPIADAAAVDVERELLNRDLQDRFSLREVDEGERGTSR